MLIRLPCFEQHAHVFSMLRRVMSCQTAAVPLQDIVGSALHKKVVLEAARKSESTVVCLALLHSPSDQMN